MMIREKNIWIGKYKRSELKLKLKRKGEAFCSLKFWSKICGITMLKGWMVLLFIAAVYWLDF